MRKAQQGTAVAICVIGLLVLAIGAAVLVNELRKERQERLRLEQEADELRQEIETLKSRRFRTRAFPSTTSGLEVE